MKKDRNCGMPPYPIYQGGPGMMQGMAPGMMQGMNPTMPGMTPSNYNYDTAGYPQTADGQFGMTSIQQEISNINRRIDTLERRIRTLESSIGTSTPTPYNNNNFNDNYKMI